MHNYATTATAEHKDVQLLINYVYPWCSQCTEKGFILIKAIKNSQRREGLLLAHWLSYKKLNIFMLCAATSQTSI